MSCIGSGRNSARSRGSSVFANRFLSPHTVLLPRSFEIRDDRTVSVYVHPGSPETANYVLVTGRVLLYEKNRHRPVTVLSPTTLFPSVGFKCPGTVSKWRQVRRVLTLRL